MKISGISEIVCPLMCWFICACSPQKPDTGFDVSVSDPAFKDIHPKVLFDEGHNNFHKADGTYEPFVNLIKNDGYIVRTNENPIVRESLAGYDILVISNAKGRERKSDPAFSGAECEMIFDWVNRGGSLLLAADHYPMGSAAKDLSRKFGVGMGCGETFDSLNYDTSSTDKSQLIFDNINHLLMDTPVRNGRSPYEQVSKVITFTGQSLFVADTNAILLKLSHSAMDIIPDSVWEETELFFFKTTYTRFRDPEPTKGNAQAVALVVGNGRVVILGEAAMITAQIDEKSKFGMNFPPNDNRQFALNIMHWLSKLI
jgi:hypothetical protein